MNAIIFSAIMGVVMMFSGILLQKKSAVTTTAIVSLLLLLSMNLLDSYSVFSINVNTHGLLHFNKFGLFFNSILIAATLIFAVLCGSEIEKTGVNVADYYALIFFVLCGTSILTSFNGLLMLFLGIEIMSIPLYILTGAEKRNLKSNEASLKYFLMGAFSTGLLLMGIALIYGATGSFALKVSTTMAASAGVLSTSFLQIAGLILLFVSMCFKVSAAPFHFWTPDVYDGAPSVFTSFMATVVKAAGFFAFLNLFESNSAILGPSWKILLSFVIVATLLVGNITAVFQQSIKRMLAYSSISQAGFMLFALYSNNDMAKEGILLYAVAYCLATIGFFAILIKVKDYTFDGFNGLAKTQPVMAFTGVVFLMSLAGIPLTAGFFAKYYMLASVVKSGGSLWIVVVAVLFAAVSVYYYFKVIQSMYFKEGTPEVAAISPNFKTGLLLVAAAVILVGVLPSIVLNWFYF
ncbi:MAG: NADH-quinone oxidoreductase subunit N [Sphingobacteriia bacterium]|nr:MAG: NADH-quinone oxidoreductase subunit N [Sphingobacteriia bacterium]